MVLRDGESVMVSPPAKPWDIDCSKDPVLTKQEFLKDCDVNVIIARCVKSGLPLPSVAAEPLFADVSEVGDYADCVRRVATAKESFMQLPAELRTEFDNDPGKLIAYVADPKNSDRLIELGLKTKPVSAPADVPPAVADVPKP